MKRKGRVGLCPDCRSRINEAGGGIGNGSNALLAASSPCRVTEIRRSASSEAPKTAGSFARDSAPTTRTCEQKQ